MKIAQLINGSMGAFAKSCIVATLPASVGEADARGCTIYLVDASASFRNFLVSAAKPLLSSKKCYASVGEAAALGCAMHLGRCDLPRLDAFLWARQSHCPVQKSVMPASAKPLPSGCIINAQHLYHFRSNMTGQFNESIVNHSTTYRHSFGLLPVTINNFMLRQKIR